MELTDGFIILRTLRYADCETIAFLANNKRIWNNLRDYFPYPYTTADAVKFLDMVKLQEPEVNFAITQHDTFMGIVSLIPQTDVYRHSAEVGYWIGEPYWGKGIGSAAVKLMTRYGFEALGFSRIFARVFSDNIASRRVLEKCGYLLEGVLRNGVIKNNRLMDDCCYAILKDEKLNNQ